MIPINSDAFGNQTKAVDPCSAKIDRNAPAGSGNSLGAKSDCNGRPTSDDSVIEAKDEMPPVPGTAAS